VYTFFIILAISKNVNNYMMLIILLNLYKIYDTFYLKQE